MADIQLGPFVLAQRIGKGGMGEVWRAHHLEQRVQVAVKVLTAAGSSRPMFVDSFKNEVRAVAALDHPHVAMVLDSGTVPRAASLASGGRLVAGTPYLAMELVEGTTLADQMGRMRWWKVENILKGLLDALAHAHARDVIHRDLKLSNVLFDPRNATFKLTDFGIAHAMAATGDPFRWGTPAYMPPEQLLGRWWEYGPWTDLYSLGCCAFALVTGERPFGDDATSSAATRRLPPLIPRFAVPPELAEWLSTLCAPEPAARYQVAADAAWTFDAMCSSFEAPDDDGPPIDDSVEIILEETTTTALQFTTRTDLKVLRMPVPGQGPRVLPPLPPNWQRNRPLRLSEHLLGAGLGLYGLRRIPTIGRNEERDALWKALGEVKASNTPRVVVLTGPAGCGKTRLGEWLMERAHEVGAAHSMRTGHSRPRGPTDGVGAMIARFLRTGGLTRDQVADRVTAALRAANGTPADPRDVQQIVELLSPEGGGDRPARRAGDRHAAIRRFVGVQARHRPLLVFLDDVQHGLDTLEFALSLIEQRPPVGPVLLVLAARDEELAANPVERAVLEEIARRRSSSRLPIGPMPEDDHRELVQQLIGLDGALAKQLEERTAGNPLFAVQLVGDWVQRKVLIPGERGWQLAAGTEVAFPDDLYATWAARIDDVLQNRPEADRTALEVASILGQRVDPAAWGAICAELGLEVSPDLLDALLSQSLARHDDAGPAGGWAFVHSMLRETLERRAEEGGRTADLHAACARWVERSDPDPEKLARHLLAAGQPEEALSPLVVAIDARCAAGEFDWADNLLAQWEEAAERVGLPPDDPRWMNGLRSATQVHRYRDRPEAMLATCDRLEAGVRDYGWPLDFLAYARAQRARIERLHGHFDRSLALYRESFVLLQGPDGPLDPEMLTSLHARLGHVLADIGSYAAAEQEFREAEDKSRGLGDVIGIGDGQIGRARVALDLGDLDAATRWAAAARETFRGASYRWGLAQVWELFGGIARHRTSTSARDVQQKLDEAGRWFRQAATTWRALGTESAAVNAELQVAMVQLELGVVVTGELERCTKRALHFGDRPLLARCRTAQLAAAARTADEPGFEAAWSELGALRDSMPFVSGDIAVMAELAGRACAELQWTDAARRAFDLAVEHWTGLQRDEDRERVLVTLDRL